MSGDEYPTTRVLTADGVVSLIGCLMGNPYINAVYIGHPGWKAMGGRIGYSAATGVMVILLSWFGIISLMTALIPVVAISPILLYIGMLIGSQAFQESPHRHAPAIIMALVPSLAAWGKLQIDNLLGAVAGIREVTPEMIAAMAQTGMLLPRALDPRRRLDSRRRRSSARSPFTSSTVKFPERRRGLAFAGGVLTFFGFMHGEAIGINRGRRPWWRFPYLVVGGGARRLREVRNGGRSHGAREAWRAKETSRSGHRMGMPEPIPFKRSRLRPGGLIDLSAAGFAFEYQQDWSASGFARQRYELRQCSGA